MRFVVDAQLPRRFCTWLTAAGHDALHTFDLPEGNRSTDSALLEIAGRENRIVVTKDDDFVQTYLVISRPQRLLLVSTGNISNAALEVLVGTNLEAIVRATRAADQP